MNREHVFQFAEIGFVLVVIAIMSGCSSATKGDGRVFLDSSIHEDSPPSWVKDLRANWEEQDRFIQKGAFQAKSNDRVNGCFDLAKSEAQDSILQEAALSVRGRIDQAQLSLSEDAEVVLGKVSSREYKGTIQGVRVNEQYFDRARVSGVERVDCYVLASISKTDMARLKNNVLSELANKDNRVKEAITKKQIEFFTPDEGKNTNSEAE